MPVGVLVLLLMAILIGMVPLAHVLRTLRQALLDSRRAQDEIGQYKTHLEQLVETRTEELLDTRDAAVAANRAKSVFLANMSHELRTPLNAIMGLSSLLRNTGVSDQQRRDLDIINRSGEHLLTLINDVLDVAKVEAGRTVITTVPCDLEALVFEVTQMIRVRAEEKQLKLQVEQTPSFPPFVKADVAKLRQILINLLGNAVKYTEEGSITLRLDGRCDACGESPTVRFEVEDTGIGIAAEDQRRIFDPFEQVANAGSQKGTGLGLAITKQFVELMGGAIELKSIPGKGSRFRAEIPLEVVHQEEKKLPEATRKVVGLEPGQPEWRILIVEDHEESRAILERMLGDVGLKVRTAGNGAVAVELFEEWRPHLIFMDLRMPVMDGIEATKHIRNLPDGAEVKIAAMTASAFESERERVLASGMQHFIRKPYRPQEVFDCLASHLGLRYQFAQEPTSAPTQLSNRTRTESLAAVPEELRKELADAVVSLNHQRVAAVIVKVADADAALAEVLRGMNDQSSYTAMLRLIEPSRLA
jgi:signal transduction histidine kinase/CheY-like chemotaxis protein